MKPTILTCKDHSVSQESFSLVYNEKFDLLQTEPVPENLAQYYESAQYISHTDSKKTIIDRIYQGVRKITLKRKLRLINKVSVNKELLDVGCGTGDFVKTCENDGWKVMGVEPHEGARTSAQQKCTAEIKETLDQVDSTFDVVTLWHVLEHVVDLDHYIERLSALVKSNGTLIIAVPNYKSHDAIHYGAFWAAYDVPRHVRHFSQTSIQLLFKDSPFSLIDTQPMKFDSYYVSLLSEKYKFGKANPLKAFWQGFQSNLNARRSSEYSSLIYVLRKS